MVLLLAFVQFYNQISDGGSMGHFQGVAGSALALLPAILLAIVGLARLRVLDEYVHQAARLVMHALDNLVLGLTYTISKFSKIWVWYGVMPGLTESSTLSASFL